MLWSEIGLQGTPLKRYYGVLVDLLVKTVLHGALKNRNPGFFVVHWFVMALQGTPKNRKSGVFDV